MDRFPTLFLSHGSPLHALDAGGAGAAWRSLADALPRPRAVLMVSAHWETSLPMLTGGDRLQTIHDFGGFPEPLYRLRYDAPGAPEVARESVGPAAAGRDSLVAQRLPRHRPRRMGTAASWMYPASTCRSCSCRCNRALGTAHHLALGRALQPLTAHGVLVIGSGHVTHNLRDWC